MVHGILGTAKSNFPDIAFRKRVRYLNSLPILYFEIKFIVVGRLIRLLQVMVVVEEAVMFESRLTILLIRILAGFWQVEHVARQMIAPTEIIYC